MRIKVGATLAVSMWLLLLFVCNSSNGFSPKTTRTTTTRTKNNIPIPFFGKHRHRSSTVIWSTAVDNAVRRTRFEGIRRAQEITSTVMKDVLAPLVGCVATNGPATNWDEFWTRETVWNERDFNGSYEHHDDQRFISHAQRVAVALERLGPTYVKFGQALSARLDLIPQPLAEALARLQDEMTAFNNTLAHEIIRTELEGTGALSNQELTTLLDSLSTSAVAAASIGQVYQGFIPGRGKVALKVQRPGIHQVVQQDSTMLRQLATIIESLPGLPVGVGPTPPPSSSSSKENTKRQTKLISTKVVAAADEFMTRVLEELDYQNEAKNMETFYRLYSHRNGTSSEVKVVVPTVHMDLCTDRLLVMEWIDGSKLSNAAGTDESTKSENLALIESGIAATLSQLLGTGIMHADPHAGNLVKVNTNEGLMLGFLDFGMLSTVPESVRDALVCAVAQVVFARDTEAVADLFGELQLLPAEVIQDKVERAHLTKALDRVFQDVLQYPPADPTTGLTSIPTLRFDKLLGGLSLLVSRFQFTLPPYFLNIARALATLEGVARDLDPSFNALQAVYPYALDRILNNPSMSPIVEETLVSLMINPRTGRFDRNKIRNLIRDSAVLGGTSKRKVVLDVIRSKSGRRITRRAIRYGLQPLLRRQKERSDRILFEL